MTRTSYISKAKDDSEEEEKRAFFFDNVFHLSCRIMANKRKIKPTEISRNKQQKNIGICLYVSLYICLTPRALRALYFRVHTTKRKSMFPYSLDKDEICASLAFYFRQYEHQCQRAEFHDLLRFAYYIMIHTRPHTNTKKEETERKIR